MKIIKKEGSKDGIRSTLMGTIVKITKFITNKKSWLLLIIPIIFVSLVISIICINNTNQDLKAKADGLANVNNQVLKENLELTQKNEELNKSLEDVTKELENTKAKLKKASTTNTKSTSASKVNTVVYTKATPTSEYTKMTVVATAYCPCYSCSGGHGKATSTGVTATAGRTIAVDPRVIPYGSEIIINNQKYRAEDCGGGIKGNKIDIFFNSHAETSAWGRRTIDIYVKFK